MLPVVPVPGEFTVAVAPVGNPLTLAVSDAVLLIRVAVIPTCAAASLGNATTDAFASSKENSGPLVVIDGPLPHPHIIPTVHTHPAAIATGFSRNIMRASLPRKISAVPDVAFPLPPFRFPRYPNRMKDPHLTLAGTLIRLEPLTRHHSEALAAASAAGTPVLDDNLYRWTVVPQSLEATTQYVNTALKWRNEGTAVPFVVIRQSDNAVIGTTRYWNIERWLWPAGHARHGNPHPDACEIGYTWFTRAAIRTGANTEAKLLMFTHAFEAWNALRICLHTDSRNTRSQTAMERLGCKREGVLRAHRMAADFTSRDSVRYSIIAAEWPETKQHILALMRK